MISVDSSTIPHEAEIEIQFMKSAIAQAWPWAFQARASGQVQCVVYRQGRNYCASSSRFTVVSDQVSVFKAKLLIS